MIYAPPSLRLVLATALLCALHTHAQPRLWGMTTMGGSNDKGTLFRVDADGTDFTVEYHFSEASGYAPEGTLCLAGNGKLYGTTNLGGTGSPAAGTLFSFDPATGVYTKLVDFNITNGGYGWSGLIATPSGALYGATYGGGGSGGSIFRVDPATDTYTILYALNQTTDGGAITSLLYRATDGQLYGCAAYGGANNAGTLFRFNPATNTYTKMHDLGGGANGKTPYGGLTEGGNGWYYGTTFEGGTDNKGILFKYAPGSNTFVKLLDFTGPNGQSPWTAPIPFAADELWGTTANGGSNGNGMIYRLTPSTDTFEQRYSFSALAGGLLFSNVTPGGDGYLYGIGAFGGANFQGTVYRFDPQTNAVTTLHDMNGPTDGYSARGDLIVAGVATSVGGRDALPGFSLLPNPTNGNFRVALHQRITAPFAIWVTNSTGQVVLRETAANTDRSLTLNVSPGLYMVTMELDGMRQTQRLVVE
ncbi:MAG: T9SS type A sorting domain-containing protein [Flavobacteriales bacterium]|nr:T9SS type A sorting domain-containing protein [Flavobacteriales bacterium]